MKFELLELHSLMIHAFHFSYLLFRKGLDFKRCDLQSVFQKYLVTKRKSKDVLIKGHIESTNMKRNLNQKHKQKLTTSYETFCACGPFYASYVSWYLLLNWRTRLTFFRFFFTTSHGLSSPKPPVH